MLQENLLMPNIVADKWSLWSFWIICLGEVNVCLFHINYVCQNQHQYIWRNLTGRHLTNVLAKNMVLDVFISPLNSDPWLHPDWNVSLQISWLQGKLTIYSMFVFQHRFRNYMLLKSFSPSTVSPLGCLWCLSSSSDLFCPFGRWSHIYLWLSHRKDVVHQVLEGIDVITIAATGSGQVTMLLDGATICEVQDCLWNCEGGKDLWK